MKMVDNLPVWLNPGVEPPENLKTTGWQAKMKPAPQYFNWFFNQTYLALKELQENGGNVDDLTQAVADLEQTVDNLQKNVDTKVDKHINEDLGHVRYIGTTNSGNAWVCVSDDIIWETVGLPLVRAKIGSSYKIQVVTTNTGNITLTLKSKDGSKVTNAYPVLNLDGTQVLANSITSGAMVTVTFNGGTFFLQGSGSGVITHGGQQYATPGTYKLTIPRGVFRIHYKMWGAGGGGGGSFYYNFDNVYGGAGGGAGTYSSGYANVKPGDVIDCTVGRGGVGGAGGSSPSIAFSGETGTPSSITLADGSRVVAWSGGGGGGGKQNPANSYAGQGGQSNINGAQAFFNLVDGPQQLARRGSYSSRPAQGSFTELMFITGSPGHPGMQGIGSTTSSAMGGGGGGGTGDASAGYPGGFNSSGYLSARQGGGDGANVNSGITYYGGHGASGSEPPTAGKIGSGGGGGYVGGTTGANGGDGKIEISW